MSTGTVRGSRAVLLFWIFFLLNILHDSIAAFLLSAVNHHRKEMRDLSARLEYRKT